ncbi:MAG: hypothetical protein WD226_03185 [Planctomycetota bacterium]
MLDRRYLGLGLWVGAVAFTLWPTRLADELALTAATPLRIAAEVTYPLRIALRAEVVARADSLEARQRADADEQQALRQALDRAARPTEQALLANRRFVFAEVEGRSAEDPDRLRAWLPSALGVLEGQPVIAGDAYVGRVATVVPRAGTDEAWIDVELVTSRDFQVGARIEEGPAGAPVFMTVGGVHAEEDATKLAVHNPSDRDLTRGLARVFELVRDADDGELARGFRLGQVERAGQSSEWSLRPEVDYLHGLFQVMVVTSLAGGDEIGPYDPVTESRAWISARPLTTGDANPRRSSFKLRRGALAGITTGAAVTARGAHLVGRVGRVGPLMADVRMLDDPGLSLVALALLDDDPVPRPLGRLVSLGRDGDALLFHWSPRVALADEPRSVRARVFTGSGDPGMATSFPVGTTVLPVGLPVGASTTLRIVPDVEGRHVSPVFVYAGARRESTR